MAIGETTYLGDLDTDGSTTAKTIQRVYQDCVDSVLQAYDWNFNAVRAKIAKSSTNPAFDFAYQYPLPGDCLRVREVYDTGLGYAAQTGYYREAHDQRERWQVETIVDNDSPTRVLVTDMDSPVNIVYSRRINSLGFWSPLAIDTLVYRVAMMIAMPITQKRSTAADMEGAYNAMLARAGMRDAQEASPTMLDSGDWLQSRW